MSGQVRLTIVAAIATTLTSLVFSLVFDYGGWLTPVLGAILVTAATGAAARRWRLPRLSVPFWQLLALFGWLVFVFARDEAFWWIIPTPSAIDRLADVFVAGINDVNRYATPVAPFRGIVALTVAGIGLCHIVVDTLAVTFRRPAVAGLPLLALYCVPSTLAPGGVGWGWFVLGAGGWLALLVADARLRFTSWGRPLGYGRGDRATEREYSGEIQTTPLSALGRRIGAASLGVAVIVPIIVPGLDEGVFGRGGGAGDGDGAASVTVQNPMVDLRRDLTRPEDRTIIRYTTDDPQPDYLRLVTLDSFDGIAWERATFDTPRTNRVRGQELPIPVGLSDAVARERRTTQLRVLDQAESWLPMPYPPARVRIEGGDWRYDNESLNVVAQDGSTIRDTEYEVVSLDLQPTAAQLRAAPAADEDYDRYVELPPGLPEQVRTEARDVVADATTPYERALALQDWFRDTSVWTYSTEVQDGNGNDDLEAFLADRTGYCEQFAATMAVMARSIGIPARVNVGFTPGTRDGDEWRVSLHDAHAWPELYFPGVGWVRFEPTPLADGRGIDPEYAGPAAERVDPSDPAAAQPAPSAAATPGAGLTEQEARLQGDEALAGGSAANSGPPRWPFVVAIVVAVLAVIPRLTRSVVRRRRFVDREDPRTRAEAAWAEVRDTVRDLGYLWSSSETPRQAALRLGDEAFLEQPGREAFSKLARVVERARYARAPGPVDDLSVEVDVLRHGLGAPLSRWRRWRARWLPASAADVLQAGTDRFIDALDWVDAGVERFRSRLTPRRWRRA
jgi:transglutaminase-like putative cysteine protease